MSRRHPHPHDGTPALAPVDGINTNMPLHARECIEHCMFSSDGPGRLMTVRQLELEGQVNKWRGGIALGIWVMGVPISAYGSGGYTQPSSTLGQYVSATSKVWYTLPANTTFTFIPQVVAIGTLATCIVADATVHVRELYL